jgi:pyruvyl transferase EpsO
MNKHSEVMEGLKAHHAIIAGMLKGKRFHFVDIPDYDNIGDLLIMLGTLRFFQIHGLTPSTIATLPYFDHTRVLADDVLVLQGGGNFGDLYTSIHGRRESLIAAFPNNRIIQLPQTLFFSSEDALAKSVATMCSHKDLHIFVRDIVSEKLAHEFTDKVYLAPDMAHQLYPVKSTDRGAKGVLRIQRVDKEKPYTPEVIKQLSIRTTTDWVELIGDERKLITVFEKLEWRLKHYGMPGALTALSKWFWVPVCRRFMNKAVDLFADHESVVTDRLHGHILACLMDKKHIVIDNSYGKNSSYMNQWTIESPLTTLAREKT